MMLYTIHERQAEMSISEQKIALTPKDNMLTTQMTECYIGPKQLDHDDDDCDQFDLDELEMEMQQAKESEIGVQVQCDDHCDQMVYNSQ